MPDANIVFFGPLDWDAPRPPGLSPRELRQVWDETLDGIRETLRREGVPESQLAEMLRAVIVAPIQGTGHVLYQVVRSSG